MSVITPFELLYIEPYQLRMIGFLFFVYNEEIFIKLDDPRPYNLNGCHDRGSFWFVASYVLYVHVISQSCSLRAICEMLHVRLLYVNKTGSSRTRRYAGSSAGMDQRA